MTPEELADLPQYFGLYFDPATGKTYRTDGTDTGFTFERARWTGPFGLHFHWPWLNPLAFATDETAAKVHQFARSLVPSSVSVTRDDTQRVFGPFTRTVERLIVVSGGGSTESYSAGWMANTIIRNGDQRAAESFRAEWMQAGIRW